METYSKVNVIHWWTPGHTYFGTLNFGLILVFASLTLYKVVELDPCAIAMLTFEYLFKVVSLLLLSVAHASRTIKVTLE